MVILTVDENHINQNMALRGKIRTWWNLPRSQKLLFFFVIPLLGLARLAILLLPFRMLARCLGEDLKTTLAVPLITRHNRRVAILIGRSVRMAARYTPWESKCLAQALVAGFLLELLKIPHGLYLGVCRGSEAEMKAHAWVCSGPIFVTGGESFSDFTVVASFIRFG